MKVYKDCEVLYLNKADLTKSGELKSFDEIDFSDFRFFTRELMYKSSIIIYDNNGEYKVLKSRY